MNDELLATQLKKGDLTVQLEHDITSVGVIDLITLRRPRGSVRDNWPGAPKAVPSIAVCKHGAGRSRLFMRLEKFCGMREPSVGEAVVQWTG